MRRVALSVLLGLMALAGTACRSDGSDAVASATINGSASVARGDGDFRPFDGGDLDVGDRLRVVSGTAEIDTPALTIELRPDSEVRIGTVVDVLRGDALARTDDKTGRLSAGTTSVAVTGAARVTRTLALTVESYRGTTTVNSGGSTLRIAALRQATLADARLLPAAASPLTYDAGDTWDRRFLGEAMAVGEQLEARSKGFTAQLRPGEGTTPGFYRLLLPALEDEPALDELVTGAVAPGEVLVGASIASLGTRGDFPDRWRSTFAFRAEGAAWGLVALDQGISDVAGVGETVSAAIGRAPITVALPEDIAEDDVRPLTVSLGSGPSPTAPPARDPAPADPSAPPPSTPPTTEPEPEPSGPLPTIPEEGPLEPVTPTVNTLIEILNGVLSGR